MKVAIPTTGHKGLDDEVSPHFGRAPTYTIVDTETDEVKIVDNTSEHMGGSGKPPEIMHGEGVGILLCSGLGQRAIWMFEQSGIEVFVGTTGTVRDALSLWRSGRLQKATEANACRESRHRY
ncbi:MAG: NifB/NifX family molybdenum-iron cluster-binding protein [Candidatus Altiarchaeota archaeon]|nr:NifB/NifX family molybdenum-iron cluster-binding protein [Candidatus Altiarchaeota archaeon]